MLWFYYTIGPQSIFLKFSIVNSVQFSLCNKVLESINCVPPFKYHSIMRYWHKLCTACNSSSAFFGRKTLILKPATGSGAVFPVLWRAMGTVSGYPGDILSSAVRRSGFGCTGFLWKHRRVSERCRGMLCFPNSRKRRKDSDANGGATLASLDGLWQHLQH